MSNHWTLWCLDCEEESCMGDDFNNREEILLELWRWRQTIAEVEDARTSGALDLEVRIDSGNTWIDAAFFLKHKEHNVKPRDEYHHISGSCTKRIAGCPTCEGSVVCKLSENHEGECQYKKRY